jgi:NADH-quinone oxidoreductase subunit H
MTASLKDLLITLVYAAGILGGILLVVLILIVVLRKFLGDIQNRVGPNRVGPGGWFQTVADALKLLIKEDVIPRGADRLAFIVAPAIVFVPAYLVYVVIPFSKGMVSRDLNIGIIYIAAITSVAVIGFILGGWASNNKYSVLGAMRSAAQMVSYEVPLVMAMIAPVILAGSLRLSDIASAQAPVWYLLVMPAVALVHLTAGLAEVNLTPFDMVEAESELVAGFNTEYSGMKFALFFLAEFANTFTLSLIFVLLFLGAWHLLPFDLAGINTKLEALPFFQPIGFLIVMTKAALVVLFTMWIRGTLPRIRVDQLMEFGWKTLIPLGLAVIVVNGLAVAVAGTPKGQTAIVTAVNWLLLILLVLAGRTKRVRMASRKLRDAGNAPVPERSRV